MDDKLKAAALAINKIRADEVGGCFKPDDDGEDPDSCIDGDCYCAQQCKAEARAAIEVYGGCGETSADPMPGDIVQITDASHGWYPALVVVDEVKSFGCQAYMIHIKSNDPSSKNGTAYIRLNRNQYERVGRAVIAIGDAG